MNLSNIRKGYHSIMTRDLIALCHIIKNSNYEGFEKTLLNYLLPMDNDFTKRLINFTKHLDNITNKDTYHFSINTSVIRFYNENKKIIDIINKYSNISSFICMNYGLNTKSRENFQYFYKYLLYYEYEINKIIPVLEKILSLGFDTIAFNENLDFTKERPSIYEDFERNILNIEYFDNIEIIPTYEMEKIHYKTTSSNYLMMIGIDDYYLTFNNNNHIFVNSLTFNPERLPNSINKQTIFDPIIAKAKETKPAQKYIRNSVNLGIGVQDLDKQLSLTTQTITKLNDIKNKSELIEILTRMKEDLEKLKLLNTEYNNLITKEISSVTPEVLENAKKLYLERKEFSSLHID